MWSRRIIQHLKSRCYSFPSTIYALSSGQGKCGVAVIRVSGPNASTAILRMTNLKELPMPRLAHLKLVHDPITNEKLDRGLIIWFPGPKSFTGEDCCEFQIHGGPAVISSILSALSKLNSYRLAEPGEFTKRAFYNGKLDLTEVEGIADLIHAETEMQRRQALLQMEGNLSNLYSKWRKLLLRNVAHVEAYIDFGDEENMNSDALVLANAEIVKLKNEIERHLQDGRRGEILRDGVKTTIVGEPNVGKSSLLNALCRRPASIVTPIPGTTRDLIQLNINVNGYPVTLTDTAGLRNETSDLIEKEGITRARGTMHDSDLLLIVVDATVLRDSLSDKQRLNEFVIQYLNNLNLKNVICKKNKEDKFSKRPSYIMVFNKIDLLTTSEKVYLQNIFVHRNFSCISCTTEDGFPNFLEKLTLELKFLCGSPAEENPSLTQMRHRYHLTKCITHLKQYSETADNIDVAAYHLRKSLKELGKITGEVNSNEIIDVIFRDFCIGK